MLQNAFLPLLAVTYLVDSTLIHYILSSGSLSERVSAANYIKDKAKKTDKIYAWDKTAALYQASRHLSAVPILITPKLVPKEPMKIEWR